MRKIYAIILCLFLIILPTNVMAQEEFFVGSGYTEDGYYYEIYYNIYDDATKSVQEDHISVKVEVEYDSILVPQSGIYWSEQIDGALYAGNLNLKSYSFYGNKTIAVYEGTLYKQ